MTKQVFGLLVVGRHALPSLLSLGRRRKDLVWKTGNDTGLIFGPVGRRHCVVSDVGGAHLMRGKEGKEKIYWMGQFVIKVVIGRPPD